MHRVNFCDCLTLWYNPVFIWEYNMDIEHVHLFPRRMFQKLIKIMYSFFRYNDFICYWKLWLLKRFHLYLRCSCVYCPTNYYHLLNFSNFLFGKIITSWRKWQTFLVIHYFFPLKRRGFLLFIDEQKESICCKSWGFSPTIKTRTRTSL